MKITGFKRMLGIFAALCIILSSVPAVYAAEGTVTVEIGGTYENTDIQALVDHVNAIRLKACREGDPNPATDGATKLTEADYVPIQWSYGLEWIAQVRASEAYIFFSHTRPSGEMWYSCVAPNGQETWSEGLGWGYGSTVSTVDGFCEEREAWINLSTTEVTGHYEALINPGNRYFGASTFELGTAVEYSSDIEKETERMAVTGEYTQTLEIAGDNISSLEAQIPSSLSVGEQGEVLLFGTVSDVSDVPFLITGGVQYSCDNESVATVDANGVITAVGAGTATVTVAAGGKETAVTVEVTDPADIKDCCEGIVPGDANEDGSVGLKDVSLMIRFCAGWSVEINEDNADVYNDGEVALRDVSVLIRYLAGWTDVRLGHRDDTTVTVTEPTCTEKGVKTITCGICGGVEEIESAPLGHEFVRGACTRCGGGNEDYGYYRLADWIAANDQLADMSGELGLGDLEGATGMIFENSIDETTGNGRMSIIVSVAGEADAIAFVEVVGADSGLLMTTFGFAPEMLVADEATGEIDLEASEYYFMIENVPFAGEDYFYAEGTCKGNREVAEITGFSTEASGDAYSEIPLTEEDKEIAASLIDEVLYGLMDELASAYNASTGETMSTEWLGVAAW